VTRARGLRVGGAPRAMAQRRAALGAGHPARRQVSIGLWLPLTPLFLLLSPFPLIAAPLAKLDPRLRRANPWRAVWVVGRLLLSLSGTRIAVDTPAVRIRIHIL
jgi:hypothetical protein